MRRSDLAQPTESASESRGLRGRADLLGAGRSGVVFKDRDIAGRLTARKVFYSEGLTKLIQYIFLGAPNPYCWNRDAIESALLRRRILAPLVRYWFHGRVRVARGFAQDWNPRARAFQLHTEFVLGRAPRLNQPFCRQGTEQIRELVETVMRPLQARLFEAGFDGLVWQAGLGNPVALANFLMEAGGDSESRWAWIDLESGVPALFPANPLELLRFYLPAAWRHRRVLFDDVEISRLRAYLAGRCAELERLLGAARFERLLCDVDALERHQRAWKSQPRYLRAVEYSRKKGRIDERQAEWYAARPVRWYAREAALLPSKLARLSARGLSRFGRWLAGVDYPGIGRGIARFLSSQKYRRRLAQDLVGRRIDAWTRRRNLEPGESKLLRAQLTRKESCAYLTDFGVHMAIKPFIKSIEWLLFPALFASGLISESTLAIAVASGGCLARTLYTLGRLIQASLRGRRRPWIALLVGAIPVAGNLAYPLQLVYSGSGQNDLLARFMLYDGATAFGRKLPIWGGPDTLTEHYFNRLPERILRFSRPV